MHTQQKLVHHAALNHLSQLSVCVCVCVCACVCVCVCVYVCVGVSVSKDVMESVRRGLNPFRERLTVMKKGTKPLMEMFGARRQ